MLFLVCVCVCVHAQSSLQPCPAFPQPRRTVAHRAPLSMGLSQQGYWSGLPSPFPGALPDPGIELKLRLLCLLHWQEDSLPPEPAGKALFCVHDSTNVMWIKNYEDWRE